MILSHLNYLAVAVATLAYFALGSVWFSPMLFSKSWMAGHNITMPTDETAKKEMRKSMPKLMLVTFVGCFVAVLALGYIETAFMYHGWMTGLKTGILASVFSSIAIALSHMYTQKSFKLFIIDAGYHVAGLIIAAVILSVWK